MLIDSNFLGGQYHEGWSGIPKASVSQIGEYLIESRHATNPDVCSTIWKGKLTRDGDGSTWS